MRAQRCNTAYLNRGIFRFGRLDYDLEDQALMTPTGLAIDLGGSLKQYFRPAEPGAVYLVHRHSSGAARSKGRVSRGELAGTSRTMICDF
jgi:hypothetical protein